MTAPTLAQAEQQLLGPGGPFELRRERVLGEEVSVFAERAPHLRALLERSRGYAEREYLVFGERRYTYGAHLAAVASVASALSQRYRVVAGDRVAILAANCPEWAITFWATVSLGAVAVGMNGWWTADEIRYALGHCRPKLLVADHKRLARIDGRHDDLPIVEIESAFESLASFAPDAALPETPIAEDDRAVILYTSGTTGRPKGAVSTHRNLIGLLGVSFFHGARVALSSGAAPPAQPALLSANPMFHVSGLYTGVVAHLAAAAKSVWNVGRFDPEQTLQLIERERITGWSPHGSMGWRVVRHPGRERYDVSSVRTIGSGGAPVTAELQAALREAFPSARLGVGVGYGLTEGTALATLAFGTDLLDHPESVGRPLPTVELEIRDQAGAPVPAGTEGEIHLRGPLVMLEYWDDPEATARAIGPGRWLCAGDVGALVEGRLVIASRRRDLILRGAENVYPVEIENRLAAHPDVEEVAVLGAPHAELGQEVLAVVVPRAGRTLDFGELGRYASETLAYYKVPSRWQLRVEPLPRNATGKVMKYLLEPGAAASPLHADEA